MVGLIVPMLVTVLIGDDNVLLKNLEYLFNEDVLMQYNGPDNPLFDTTSSARYFILICVCLVDAARFLQSMSTTL